MKKIRKKKFFSYLNKINFYLNSTLIFNFIIFDKLLNLKSKFILKKKIQIDKLSLYFII